MNNDALNDALEDTLDAALEAALELPRDAGQPSQPELLLGHADCGFSGVIQEIRAENVASALSVAELESRLIELGFVEGAKIEILHEGLFGRDPIAVRIDNATIAVRRREAMAVVVA
jgi:ferrous iron transport protein A